MRKIPYIVKTVLMTASMIWATGCGGGVGGGSSSGSSSGSSYRHPDIDDHMTVYVADPQACTECHGIDLTGDDGPSCLTECHMESSESVHLLSWDGLAIYREHGSFVETNGTTKCSNKYCHGPSLTGVTNSGPSCSTCHSWPFTPGTVSCSFCHDYPPSGAQYPNTAGKHAKHVALPNVDCSACHTGAGDGTANHYNGSVEVSFATEFNSKSGTASFNSISKTCSYVSCHGGPRTQTYSQFIIPASTPSQTPDWLNGAITVNVECTACHVRGGINTLEYNSYYSGQHKDHVWSDGIICTECHEPALLSNSHFTDLDTPAMSGAGATIYDDINYNASSCTVICHGNDHDSENW